MDRKTRILTGILSSFLLISAVSAYRKIFTFNQLCEMSGGAEGMVSACPSLIQVFAVTLISPVGLILLLVGTPVIYLVLGKLN